MDILIFLSEFMVPLTVFYIVGSGILAKRPVFDDFLDGAKGYDPHQDDRNYRNRDMAECGWEFQKL